MDKDGRRDFSKTWDGWRAPALIATLVIVVPNGLVRLAPLGWDVATLIERHGWAVTLGQGLPHYGETLMRAYGQRLWLCPLLLAVTFAFAWLASRSCSIGITKAVLRLGFRLEASGDSHLLHPQRLHPERNLNWSRLPTWCAARVSPTATIGRKICAAPIRSPGAEYAPASSE